MTHYLEFEKPLAEIEGKAEELRAMARANKEMNVEKEARALDKKAADPSVGPLQGHDALAQMPGGPPPGPGPTASTTSRRCSPTTPPCPATGPSARTTR